MHKRSAHTDVAGLQARNDGCGSSGRITVNHHVLHSRLKRGGRCRGSRIIGTQGGIACAFLYRCGQLIVRIKGISELKRPSWPMHDKLFANGRRLSTETIASIAKDIGLDMETFRADAQSANVKRMLQKDIADGDKVDIQGTPTIFINEKRYNGSLEMPLLKPVLDAELKGKK